jgi:hypothetical protein
MNYAPSPRLKKMADKYSCTNNISNGEAFLNAFDRFLKKNRESLLDITLAALSAQISVKDGIESVDPLLLKAIYDTNPSLAREHIFSLSDSALQGAVNSAKGKYFEYLVAEKLNQGEQVGPLLLQEGQTAQLAESMIQPGWDLRIVDEHGAIIEYLQLKATDSVGYNKSKLERYPYIHILSTDEVAHSGLVLNSGISDQVLEEKVGLGIDTVGASLTESFWDHFHPLLPLIGIAMYEGYQLSIGTQSLDSFKLVLARRSQRIVATQLIGATVYALGGGIVSIPIAFAGGLIFDRTINQDAMASAYYSHKSSLLSLRLLQQHREFERGNK